MFKMNFLKMRTNSALKKNKAMRTSIPYKQAQSIGIIFTVEDKQKHHDIKEFVHQLEQEGKKVQVLEFLPEKKRTTSFYLTSSLSRIFLIGESFTPTRL